jgi:hypothetical protein
VATSPPITHHGDDDGDIERALASRPQARGFIGLQWRRGIADGCS